MVSKLNLRLFVPLFLFSALTAQIMPSRAIDREDIFCHRSYQGLICLDYSQVDFIFDFETNPKSLKKYFLAISLTDDLIKEMAAWRNERGLPWTTWAYEKELTVATKQAHSIRRALALYLTTEGVWEAFDQFIYNQKLNELKKNGISNAENKVQDFKNLYENMILDDDPTIEFNRMVWFRENVAQNIFNIEDHIAETFAWYTSPDYEKGSLPEELESILQQMAEGRPPGYNNEREELKEQIDYHYAVFKRLQEKGYQHNSDSGPPLAGPDVVDFFYAQSSEQALGYMDCILGLLNKAYNKEISSENFKKQFIQLVDESAETLPLFVREKMLEYKEGLETGILSQADVGYEITSQNARAWADEYAGIIIGTIVPLAETVGYELKNVPEYHHLFSPETETKEQGNNFK